MIFLPVWLRRTWLSKLVHLNWVQVSELLLIALPFLIFVVMIIVLSEIALLTSVLVVFDRNFFVFPSVLIILFFSVKVLGVVDYVVDYYVTGVEGLHKFLEWLKTILLSLIPKFLCNSNQNVSI